MRTSKPRTRWVVATLLCLAGAAAAEAQDIRGFYVGVGAGLFNYEEEDDEIGIRISDSAAIYRIIGGWQLNDNYAIEAGFARSNDIKEQLFGVNPVGDLVSLDLAVETEVKTLRVLALAPFSGLSMFGSVGFYDADFTTTFSLNDRVNPQRGAFEQSDSGVTVAGGIQYEWPRIALRGEYEWFDTDDIDSAALNLIAVFRF